MGRTILPTSNSDENKTTTPSTDVFDLLHKDIQQWIWSQEQWTTLRPIQEDAIPIIIGGDSDVILSSPTASGKTEAAFLPILSRIAADRDAAQAQNTGFDVVYISPLKALINDQYERLQDIGSACDIPIHRRHGDVSSSKKRKALEDPNGVLLITPESVEALLLHQPSLFHQAVRNLSYIVLDEIHSFIGTPRGKQLQSLIHRIEKANGEVIPCVALSATVGDPEMTAEFLRPGAGDAVDVIESNGSHQGLKLLVKGYEHSGGAIDETDDIEASGTTVDIADHIFTNLRGKDNLIFANRRSNVELYTDLLKRLSKKKGIPNEFYAHHGNLSKEIRESTELALKKANSPASVVCTTTLELGIDIGWMDSIAQIGSPPSVSSMRQRLGRSGREDDPAVLRIYIRESEVNETTSLYDMLRIELIQTIAMVDLLLDRWYEPPNIDALELSTMIQQILSLIAEYGGIQASKAYDTLCTSGPFAAISTTQFRLLLRSLANEDLISQAGDGDLIMGIAGERLIGHYDFYSAFWSPDEYRLVSNEETIGSLPITSPLVEGQLLIFGGQRWEVKAVDEDKQIAFLQHSPGGRIPLFGGDGPLIHDRIREEMYSVYVDNQIPRYLDTGGEALLEEGRTHFERFGLQNRDIVQQGSKTLLFLWTGDRVVNTIHILLTQMGFQASKHGPILQLRNCQAEELLEALQRVITSDTPNPAQLAECVENKIVDKHDHYLPEELLRVNYASKQFEIGKAIDEIDKIVSLNS